jgi:tripartite-type tricarboxylate transporter receptor subunit TctC
MTKYIPGNPAIIVKNMPGAGAMIAANHVYGVAKPDGLTLGWIAPALYFDQLVGRKEAQYDWAKFSWIGSPVEKRTPYVHAHGFSLQDPRRHSPRQRAAEVWFRRGQRHRLLFAQAFRGNKVLGE